MKIFSATKFFITALIFWTLNFSNAFAYEFNDFNWDEAEEISNKVEFYDYVTFCEEELQTVIPVILVDGFEFDWGNNWKMAPVQWQDYHILKQDGDKTYMVLEIQNYPGTRISEAYLRDDTSFLTKDEKRVYDSVTESLMNISPGDFDDEYLQERFLLRFLEKWVKYTTSDYSISDGSEMPRFVTAIGAFLDKKANCQGYSDAFYMLGNMWGFDVKRVVGNTPGGLHMWNTITFKDGRSYFVDVTWCDVETKFTNAGEVGNNIYFNAPVEIISATHTWDEDLTPKVVKKVDENYYFVRKGAKFDTCYDACDYLARQITEGHRIIYAMAPFDESYANQEKDYAFLYNEILVKKYNWHGEMELLVTHLGDYLFFTAGCPSNY